MKMIKTAEKFLSRPDSGENSGHTRKSKRRKFILPLIIAMFSCITLISGCTPYKEIKNMSIVEGMGFDTGTDSGFSLTFQIYNPKGGSQNAGGKSTAASQNLLSASNGKTIYDAIRNVTLQLGKKLYFSNTSVYIVSEGICKNSIDNLIDFLERAPEIRPGERLFVAKGNSYDILGAKKDGEIISADEIKKITDSYYTSSKIMDFTLEDIYEAESEGIQDIALPALKVSLDGDGNSVVSVDGTAVFRKNKLAGYLDSDETRGVLWVLGKVKSGIIVVTPAAGGKASLEVSRGKSDIIVKIIDGAPAITVNIEFGTDIAEMETDKNTDINSELLSELATLQNKVVCNEVESAFNKCLRQYGSDIFGFGSKIYEDEPETWKKISSTWNDQLKNLQVTVNVTSHVDYTGVITNKTTNK